MINRYRSHTTLQRGSQSLEWWVWDSAMVLCLLFLCKVSKRMYFIKLWRTSMKICYPPFSSFEHSAASQVLSSFQAISDPWLVLWGCSPKYLRSNIVMHPKYCLLIPLINPFGGGSNAGRSRMLRKKLQRPSLPPHNPNCTYLRESSRWSLQEGSKMEAVSSAFLRLFWMYSFKNHKKRYLIQVRKN